MDKLFSKVVLTNTLTKNEIIAVLSVNSQELFTVADSIRKNTVGDAVHLRALIEFSNICKQNCLYCGIRRDNKLIPRYRLTPEEIIQTAKSAVDNGYKTIVLQSGEDPFFTVEKLSFIISEIKKSDVALTLSVGEMTKSEYKKLKDAGADRFLLRIETTDKNLYKQMHPDMSLNNRIQCLNDLKSLKFETGTGNLIGLPNQSIESLADDILFFKELNADMVGIGPFIPHPDTPLANLSSNIKNFDNSLKVMAITRLLLPDINIPATTAMESIKPDGRITALKSGANVVMPNVLPISIAKKYEIYPDKSHSSLEKIKSDINSINRFVSDSCGFRIDYLR